MDGFLHETGQLSRNGGNSKQVPFDEMILQQVLKGQGELQTKVAIIDKKETEEENISKHVLVAIAQLLNRIDSLEKKDIESENALRQMQRTIDTLEAKIHAKQIDTSIGQNQVTQIDTTTVHNQVTPTDTTTVHNQVTHNQNMDRIDQLEANISVISNWETEKNSMFQYMQDTIVVLQNNTEKCLQRNAVLEHRITQLENSSEETGYFFNQGLISKKENVKSDENNAIQHTLRIQDGIVKEMQSKIGSIENKTGNVEITNRLLEERLHKVEVFDKSHVAFTAITTTHLQGISVGQRLRLSNMKSNIGNGYDPITGVFKAPVSGIYGFYFMIRVQNSYICWINLVKNGNTIVTAWGRDDGNSPNFGFVRLNVGEAVWLVRGSYRGSCSIDELSSFSGFLFYPVF